MYRVWILMEGQKGTWWKQLKGRFKTYEEAAATIQPIVEGEDNAVCGLALPKNVSPATSLVE